MWAALPLWSVDFIPIQDLAGHLATVRVCGELGNTESVFFGRYFHPEWLLPNALFFYAVRLLSLVMEINIAAKVVLSAYVFFLPVSMGAFFRSCGGSRWLGLMGLWLVYSDLLAHGFVSFVLGIPLLFFFLVYAQDYVKQPSKKKGCIVVLFLVVCFLCHAQIFLQACLFGLVLTLLSWDGWRMLGVRILPYVFGSIPFFAWFLRFFMYPPSDGVAEVTFGGLESELGFKWANPERLISQFLDNSMMRFDSQADETALLLMILSLLVLLWARRGSVVSIHGDSRQSGGLRNHTVECLTVAALAGYILLPLHMKGQAEISSRFLPFVLMMLPGWGAIPRKPVAAVAIILMVVVGSGLFHRDVKEHFQEYEAQEMGDLRGMMSLLDEKDRLAYLRPDRKHRIVKRGASWYLDSYHMVLNGGLNRMPFHVIYPHHTVIFPQAAPPRVHEVKIQHFPGSERARWYTHVLVYSKGKPNFRGRERNKMSLLAHTGSLWLYRLIIQQRDPPDVDKQPRKKTVKALDVESFRSGSRFLDRLVRMARAQVLREEREKKRKEAVRKRKEERRKELKRKRAKRKRSKTKRTKSKVKKAPINTDHNGR
jgi:hypothetical protein